MTTKHTKGPWLDMKDHPGDDNPVLLSLKWLDAPVVATFHHKHWYSNKEHVRVEGDGCALDDFMTSDIEGWLPIPVPKWKVEQDELLRSVNGDK